MTNRVLDKSELAAPGSPEWARIVTASKIPTILGVNPFETEYELWMIMSGMVQPEQLEGDHLEWGHLAEESLVRWWLHKNPGWKAGKDEVAYTDTDLPFPNQATLDRRAVRGSKRHIIECKTSDSRLTWENGLPTHYYVQAIAQMGISGIHTASVVAQLHSTVPQIYEVEWDPDLWNTIVEHVAKFVETLGEAEPPEPPKELLHYWVDQPSFDDDVELSALEGASPTTYRIVMGEYEGAKQRLDEEKKRLQDLAGGRRVTVDGKVFMSMNSGRFAQKNLPKSYRHLLEHPDVQTPKFDAKKFKEKYPDVYEAGISEPTYTFKNIWK
ncbi:YqaJ viral recombinase family protein [Corynebacterium lubricantis]|uniref:YqaJ viral recombinase family protein n=1 Tax=Corynebacterium lubricantis TaxID=541095 RepID=UPI000379D446|nr:YqaJ viral recombinase family protein [Corynebacterium lubricantis]